MRQKGVEIVTLTDLADSRSLLNCILAIYIAFWNSVASSDWSEFGPTSKKLRLVRHLFTFMHVYVWSGKLEDQYAYAVYMSGSVKT